MFHLNWVKKRREVKYPRLQFRFTAVVLLPINVYDAPRRMQGIPSLWFYLCGQIIIVQTFCTLRQLDQPVYRCHCIDNAKTVSYRCGSNQTTKYHRMPNFF